MLNYRSVTNSEPQIRSNPALRHCPPAFQKNVETLLQDIHPPFPTYARALSKHESILSKHPFHTWIKPAHLRSQWIVITDTMPVIIMDCKNTRHSSKIRIPVRKLRLQEVGTILLEGAWDAQDHVLWIWDVLYWDRNLIWNSEPYSKRWDILKEIVVDILDVGNPMSDAQVQLPTFETIRDIRKRTTVDSAYSVEFQPEGKGQRRLCFFQPRNLTQMHQGQGQRQQDQRVPAPVSNLGPMGLDTSSLDTKRTIIQEPVFMIDEDEPTSVSEKPNLQEMQKIQKVQKIQKMQKIQKAEIRKDKNSKLPDTYRVLSTGNDLGLLVVRSLDMSKKLRELFQTRDKCVADVEWHEPFQKYELKQLYVSPL